MLTIVTDYAPESPNASKKDALCGFVYIRAIAVAFAHNRFFLNVTLVDVYWMTSN